MKKTFFELIADIQKDLDLSKDIPENKENNKIPKDTIDKYNNFKKWLDENGAIYPKLSLPVKFSNIIGCQAAEDINQNSCIFYIPYKLLIDASNVKLDYIPKSLKNNNTIKLVLFLLEEYEKKEKSFYKPYIDIILLNDYSNYTPFWSKDDCLDLNDDMVEDNINYYISEITDYYQEIFEKNDRKCDFILFKLFYVFVFSRQFNIGDNKMFLIPLADLLNHSPYADIKYEFLDSKNFVMKYTSDFNDNNNLSKDIMTNNLQKYTDFSDFFKNNKKNNIIKDSNEIKAINVEELEDDEKKYELTNDDYFVISTNSQEFKKGSQVFNNYGICSNEYLLVNLGFCLLDNPADKTRVILSFSKAEEKLKKYLISNYMQDCLNKKTYNREKVIYIRLYIKRSKIATKILNILRYNVYGDKKKFDKKKEIECYKNYVEFIEKNISARNYSQFKLINDVKEKIYKKGISNDNRFNIAVFKLTQKLNLIYQKEVMNNMITILKNDSKNEIKKYEDFIRFVQNSDKIKSIYLKVEDIKTMIINYLFKMINRKNNK
jgi:hypothetical protein